MLRVLTITCQGSAASLETCETSHVLPAQQCCSTSMERTGQALQQVHLQEPCNECVPLLRRAAVDDINVLRQKHEQGVAGLVVLDLLG